MTQSDHDTMLAHGGPLPSGEEARRSGIDPGTPPEALRAAISRLAVHTPDRVYGSHDLNPPSWGVSPLQGLTPAFLFLGARGAREVPDGCRVTNSLEGMIDEDGVDFGDWEVSVSRHVASAQVIDRTAIVPGEAHLSDADPETIRASLSHLSGVISRTIFLPEDFGSSHDTGSKPYAAVERSGMFICSKLRPRLKAGDALSALFVSVTHGLVEASTWKVEMCRLSFGDDRLPEADR